MSKLDATWGESLALALRHPPEFTADLPIVLAAAAARRPLTGRTVVVSVADAYRNAESRYFRTASIGRTGSAPRRSCRCRVQKWTRSAGMRATSSSSPATPMSITRASAWRSSAGCSRRTASASASSPSRTGRAPSRSRRSGRPALFFGVTGGNMDSMVNRYTADRRLRHNDSYTPGGEGGTRPDRSVIVYAQRCREAFRDVPIVLGGIESSLRRIAHYDYWSDKVRRSILARRQGRYSAVRQCRAGRRRSGASARPRRRYRRLRRHPRRRAAQVARARGLDRGPRRRPRRRRRRRQPSRTPAP